MTNYVTKTIGSENNPLAVPANSYSTAQVSASDDGTTVSFPPGQTCQALSTGTTTTSQQAGQPGTYV
jgi:hypothetical protein